MGHLLYPGLIAALLCAAGAAPAETLSPKSGGKAEHAVEFEVTQDCKVVATVACDAAETHLGSLTARRAEIRVTRMDTEGKSHCIDPKSGAFLGEGLDGKAIVALVFTSNRTYGFDRTTVHCTRSDKSAVKHRVTMSVAKE